MEVKRSMRYESEMGRKKIISFSQMELSQAEEVQNKKRSSLV
jgi:hypothetical protein